jgi:hypothetical protein
MKTLIGEKLVTCAAPAGEADSVSSKSQAGSLLSRIAILVWSSLLGFRNPFAIRLCLVHPWRTDSGGYLFSKSAALDWDK